MFVQLTRLVVSYNYYSTKWFDKIKEYPLDKSEFTGDVWSDRLEKLIFPAKWFEDYVEMKFEDTTVRLPIGWEKMLQQMFDEYMELPPKEEQISHHEFSSGLVDFSRSYKKYQQERLTKR